MTAWYEDEGLWRALEPFLFPDDRLNEADAQTGAILRLAGGPTERVLDLACGPGAHCAALARRGLSVTGVDSSPYLLEKARQRAEGEELEMELVLADMRDFERPESFDLALSLYTSFGYFDDPSDDLAVLRHLWRSLRPAGVLVMDLMGKEQVARIYEPTTEEEAPGGALLVRRTNILRSWSWMQTECLVVRGSHVERCEYGHRLYSAVEIEGLLREAGFARVDCFGDFDASEYGPDAERLVVVARKPAPTP